MQNKAIAWVALSWLLGWGGPFAAASGWVPFEVGVVLAGGGVLLALLLLGVALQRRRAGSAQPDLLWAAPVAAVGLLALGAGLLAHPWVHDVATDLSAPPPFHHLGPRDERSPTFSDEAQRALRSAYPDLQPTQTSVRRQLATGHALVAARDLPGWQTRALDVRRGVVEGTARSLLGQRVQLAVRVQGEGKRARVDVRSRTLGWLGDFGTNARMIRHFQRALGTSWLCRPPQGFARGR